MAQHTVCTERFLKIKLSPSRTNDGSSFFLGSNKSLGLPKYTCDKTCTFAPTPGRDGSDFCVPLQD